MSRENTGPHPLPPLVEPQRGSEPPVSARGLSWKAIIATLGVLAGAAGYAWTYANDQAEERARARATQAAIERVEANTDRILHRLEAYDARLDTHDTRIAVLRRDADAAAHELETLKNRNTRRRYP